MQSADVGTIYNLQTTLEKAITALKRYSEAWRGISQEGKSHLTTVSNAILTLSSIDELSDTHYKPGDLRKAETRGREGMQSVKRALGKAGKLLEGMMQELRWVDERVENVGVDEVVWWSVTVIMWKCWMKEIVEMFGEDLRVKEWCVEQVGKMECDRERLYCLCAAWLEMPPVDGRKLEFLLAAFSAEKDAWNDERLSPGQGRDSLTPRKLTPQTVQSREGHSPAMSMLLS